MPKTAYGQAAHAGQVAHAFQWILATVSDIPNTVPGLFVTTGTLNPTDERATHLINRSYLRYLRRRLNRPRSPAAYARILRLVLVQTLDCSFQSRERARGAGLVVGADQCATSYGLGAGGRRC